MTTRRKDEAEPTENDHRPLLDVSNSEQARRASEIFRRAGYAWSTIRVLLDLPGGWVAPRDIPYFARRLDLEKHLDMLAALFVLGLALPIAQVRTCLGVETLKTLLETRLLADRSGEIRGNVAVTPFQGLLLAHDWWPRDSAELPHDHVMGVSPVSMTLAAMTPRSQVGLSLDIGTGSGLQALLAARHSHLVVATDINARAMNYATFNCRLNGIENVVLVKGSFFEPFAKRTVDLVVSNPPFVISPQRQFVFRDGGAVGDALSREMVIGAWQSLTPGGWASILIDWIHDTDSDWEASFRRWLEPLDAAVWLVRIGTMDTLKYAAAWNRDWTETYGELLDAWTAYLKALGARRISSAAVVMRQLPPGSGLLLFSDTFSGFLGSAPEQIAAVFEGQQILHAARSFVELRGRSWAFSADHRVTSDRRLEKSETNHALAWTNGLPLTTDISSIIERTGPNISAQAIVELAADNPEDAAFTEEVRRLLLRGFILEVGLPPGSSLAP